MTTKFTNEQLSTWADKLIEETRSDISISRTDAHAESYRAQLALLEIARTALENEPVALVEYSDFMTAEEATGDKPRRKAIKELSDGALVVGQLLYAAPPTPEVPSAMTPIVEDGETIAYERNGERFSTIVGSTWNTCRAAMLHSLGNSEQLELVSDPHTLPSEMTPEMMRAVQLNSELGAYVAANLSGAYGLFAEFWKVACLAAGKSPAITDEARLISSTDCLRIGQPVTPDVRVANKVRAGGFGYLRVTQGDYGKLQVDFDRFIFDQGSAPETGKFIPKHMFQGIINRLQEHCDELTEEPLVNILDGLCERYKAPDGAKDPE